MIRRLLFVVNVVGVLLRLGVGQNLEDELKDHISPEDLQMFLDMYNSTDSGIQTRFSDDDNGTNPEVVDCFGLGSFINRLPWIFNLEPDSSEEINTHFYFSSRDKPDRVRVEMRLGQLINLGSVDFKPSRRTAVIIHGFMSHSNSSWVHDMTKAFLKWDDMNVIAVDWSNGGNTWKYWRAVANTRRVGADVTEFMSQLQNITGVRFKDFHFVGHSLGAHISSFVSNQLGGVGRITGLDPAQPCFRTEDENERLDDSDADFVDVIHTNGRLLKKIGFGLPEQIGHADFYPNGGMRQPGCRNETTSGWSRLIPFYSRLQQAICSHGRSYLLFTESLLNKECAFKAQRWNLTFEGLDWNLTSNCQRQKCAEMGIKAVGGQGVAKASGPYFTLTTDMEPFCSNERDTRLLRLDLLKDLKLGFTIGSSLENVTSPNAAVTRKGWFSHWLITLFMFATLCLNSSWK